MYDALILEDEPKLRNLISLSIDPDISCKFVEDTNEFVEYLSEDKLAKLYFLDDRVKNQAGAFERCFIQNCSRLLDKYPNALVFYTGSTMDDMTEEYCKKNEIYVVDKVDIGQMISQMLDVKEAVERGLDLCW